MTNNPQPEGASETRLFWDQALFRGYLPPTSNTTYTPNQFFDVVLPHSSRGCARLVAYMIRKTLGWCDADGNPQETEILVGYRDLERNAGVGHSSIAKAIEEAIEKKFIRCVRQPRASQARSSAVTGLFELVWDRSGTYTTDLDAFAGFYGGEGHRTFIPNQFFDFTIKSEPLAVVKVIGMIIRHTIGFQTEYGFRRQRVEMSFNILQRRTRLSRRALSQALQQAMAHNHVARLREGFFDPSDQQRNQAAVYGLRWVDSDIFDLTAPKSTPGPDAPKSGVDSGPLRKVHPGSGGTDRSEKSSRTTPKSSPENRSEKYTYRNNTSEKNTSQRKQQQRRSRDAVAAEHREAFDLLKEQGFAQRDAQRLAETYPLPSIRDQINWLERRSPRSNPLGMLRRAIEENWDAPVKPEPNEQPAETPAYKFASHYYAGFHASKDEPAAEPSANDLHQAERFLGQVLKFWPGGDHAAEWGSRLGALHAKAQQFSDRKTISCVVALRRHGDELKKRLRVDHDRARQEVIFEATAAHRAEFYQQYVDYLREEEQQIRASDPIGYRDFEDHRGEERAQIERNRFFRSEQRDVQLAAFDSEERRLEDLASSSLFEVLSFEEWDEQLNPTPFEEDKVML